MYPIGESSVDKGPKVRRYPYIILAVDPPKCELPEGSLYMEAIVFSLSPYPASKVLADYCEVKKLNTDKYHCHPVVFAKDLRREGTGTLCIRREGDGFHGRIDWRR